MEMMKKIFGILMIAFLVASCANSTGEKKSETEAAPVAVEFASLIENPAGFLNKDITIEGSVVHVCKHSGKKMFIVGENPDIRLFISADDEVPVFPMELLGSTVSVKGHLAMVAEAAEEGEHAEGSIEGMEEVELTAEGEDCETEAAVAAQPVLANYVLHYKSHEEK